MGAPRKRNIRSVWSRDSPGSSMQVFPLACNPASTRALLSWALATGKA
jgi:hypothetical protein